MPRWHAPAWRLPPGVQAAVTHADRPGIGGYGANLALHVGDDADAVVRRREALQQSLGVRSIRWLTQVHGAHYLWSQHGDEARIPEPPADASLTRDSGHACAVMVADCVPILLARRDGAGVGAVHAGWRGLANGVIDNAVAALGCGPDSLTAWIGPAICRDHYEVDAPVMAAFPDAAGFVASRPGHALLSLQAVATAQLLRAGVVNIAVDATCTAATPQKYYSHRAESVRERAQAQGDAGSSGGCGASAATIGNPQIGRFAALIWRL